MASLVGAVYKGTTKAASATIGATYSKVAGQIPTPTRAIYNLGLGVGPLLESIVSEMSRGKPKPTQNQQKENESSKATAEGLRLVAVQVSSLSSIMSDLRNIALMQLKENKASNQRLRQLEVQRRFGEQEDIIEKIKSPLSSLVSQPGAEKQKEGILSKLIPAMGFLKTGIVLALSGFLVDKFLPQTSQAIKDAVKEGINISGFRDSIETISKQVEEGVQSGIKKLVPERIQKALELYDQGKKELEDKIGKENVSAIETGILTTAALSLLKFVPYLNKLPIGKLSVGAGLATAANELTAGRELTSGETLSSVGEGVAATAGAIGSVAIGKKFFGSKEDPIDGDGKGKPGRISTPPPSATDRTFKSVEASNDTKFKQSLYERIKSNTAPKLQKIIQRISFPAFVRIVGVRFGMAAAAAALGAAALGPVSVILLIISAGTLAAGFISFIDSLYDDLNDYVDDKSKPSASSLARLPELDQKAQASALSKPGISDQNTPVPAGAPFDLERYMNTVAMRESSNNIDAKNPLSSASGKFQFLRGTFEGTETATGIRDLDSRLKGISFEEFNKREDLQNIAMKILTNMNYDFLRDGLGREPTEEEVYLAHFLGWKGALKLIKSAEKGEAVSSAVGSKVMMANPNMFPSASESSRDVLKRITGYYTKGKVSKIGAPNSINLEPPIPFDKNNVASQVDEATKKISETSLTLSQSVYSSLQGIMDALSGNVVMNDGKSTSNEFTSSGPAATADASANEPTSREKDKLLFYAADSGYYGRR